VNAARAGWDGAADGVRQLFECEGEGNWFSCAHMSSCLHLIGVTDRLAEELVDGLLRGRDGHQLVHTVLVQNAALQVGTLALN